ncbi:hypothetical protein [uncultured Bradyrhizobium sp.]|uniref:hypothetical protein n=1 Tax=uncultured Bradyrhizobium sp. TaxID=199684 RepID=UPI0035CC0AA8
MSYLDVPRLAFAGYFQADVSTINNVVRYYDNEAFKPQYQHISADGKDGGWNPEGTGIFRLMDCRITGAQLKDASAAADPVIGMALENANDRVFGKIVDLDPQQQMVSEIWGMGLRLSNGVEQALFAGDYLPSPFTNLWGRQQAQSAPHDQTLAAVYQSVLHNVAWTGHAGSQVLETLQRLTEDHCLSINMNVYGYGRDPGNPRYTTGRVAGVIGPYRRGEPKRFVMGRQMISPTPAGNPWGPTSGIFSFQCKVHEDSRTVAADFGNCLQIQDASGAPVDQGQLSMAVLKTDGSSLLSAVTASEVAILGTVDYLTPGWYARTAGVQTFDYSADPWCIANIANHPLLLLTPAAGGYTVLVQESLGGLFARTDDFVCRLNPGQTKTLDIYASRYGKPLAATILLSPTPGILGITGTGGPPGVKLPPVATPANGIDFPPSTSTDSNGRGALPLTGATLNPPMPRGYIDGQIYGVGYQLKDQPAATVTNFWNYVSALVFSPFEVPARLTWFADIQPVLTQYGNLYPIMSKHLVDLGDYDSVVAHLKILRLAFALPIGDPNHMPVTRDLSDRKRAMILFWIDHPGADGLPVKGTAAPAARAASGLPAAPEPPALKLEPLQTRGKTEILLQYQAAVKAEKAP